MVAEWIGQWLTGDAGSRTARRSRPTTQLNLEQLDERLVPAAIRNLPGLTSFSLGPQDDTPSPNASLGFNINFFGVNTNNVFVNNNGNVTLGSAFSTFTPSALNTDNGGIPIIAAFFADVDTTGVGSGIVTYGTDVLCDYRVFGVNFIDVGYFNANVNKLNSFQLLLVDRSDTGAGNFDIEFNYDQIQWETGDVSGGTNGLGGSSAAVGYTNGSGVPGTFFQLPGSLVPGSFIDGGPQALVSHLRQSSTPGRYHFLVRNGLVVSGEGFEVTDGTRRMFPFRYITALDTGVQRGLLTIANISNTGVINECLDITSDLATGSTYPGPITVVFPVNLPNDIQILNVDGYTKSGNPYVLVNVDTLPRDNPVLRVAYQINNPSGIVPSTFFTGDFSYRVFAGPFDPNSI